MKIVRSTLSVIALLISTHVYAAVYAVPPASESLIGDIKYAYVTQGDDVVNIAQKYNLGFNAVKNANPQLDVTHPFPMGATIQIPTLHMLPGETRKGIVINLPEMRMYYYPANSSEVLTYPIGIGKIGKTIPIRKTSITRKKKDPAWIPPQDIREFNLKQGIVLPKIMPSGPDNPLGPYAIYLQIPTFLIHSTIFPYSVGTRASFGCIRMYESDIETFFPTITKGIPVLIINQPVKVGWQDNALFMEAHEPLEEHRSDYDDSLPGMVHMITTLSKDDSTLIDWQQVAYIAKERDGIPHEIGEKL